MYKIKRNVQIFGKMDFQRFKMMTQNMCDKEFKENCPESKTNFWHTVLAYLESLEETFFTDSFFEEYNGYTLRAEDRMFIASFLISSLKRIGCSDIQLIKEIIRSCAEYCDLYYDQPDYRVEEFISVPGLVSHTYDLFLSGSFDDIVHYKHELAGYYLYNYFSMDVAIESANEDFTNSLMKYGWFSRGNMSTEGTLVKRVVKLFASIWIHINGNIVNDEVFKVASGSLVMEFLSYISQKHPEYPEKRPKTNIFFILKIIKAIFLEQHDDPTAQKYANCVNLFYRIIPEPFVPHVDVKDVLCFLLKHADHREEIIEKYLSTYTKLFGVKPATPYAPRKLKHLSRCAVRNVIIKNSNTLEMSVNQLRLPNYLKRLLLAEV